MSIISLYKRSKDAECNFSSVLIRALYYRFMHHKKLLLHHKVKINGVNNIITSESLEIGMNKVGFTHKSDITYLNIRGKLELGGYFTIGRGCRFDIGENAEVYLGKGGYINPFTNVIIMHKLVIGDNCAVSWDCQFLDEDFHVINYPGKNNTDNSIIIGSNVWIGCGAKIYKGTKIADGCVIASDSVVKGEFSKQNCLIGGNPAKILKEEISWS